MKPCIIGVVLATGVYMTCNSISWEAGLSSGVVALILAAVLFGSKLVAKKKISPIMFILVAACLGIIVYGM